jgi:hypothetical protein
LPLPTAQVISRVFFESIGAVAVNVSVRSTSM